MKKLLLLPFLFSLSLSGVELGKNLPSMTLDGDKGGRVTGQAWSSSELKGKVHVLFYVDPDESDLNDDFSAALKAAQLDHSKFASVAIVNMAATWKPNFAIESVLEGKQEKFPNTIYVKDMDKHLIKAWDIEDDNNDVIVLDKAGKVIYYHAGQIDPTSTKKVIKLIQEHM